MELEISISDPCFAVTSLVILYKVSSCLELPFPLNKMGLLWWEELPISPQDNWYYRLTPKMYTSVHSGIIYNKYGDNPNIHQPFSNKK